MTRLLFRPLLLWNCASVETKYPHEAAYDAFLCGSGESHGPFKGDSRLARGHPLPPRALHRRPGGSHALEQGTSLHFFFFFCSASEGGTLAPVEGARVSPSLHPGVWSALAVRRGPRPPALPRRVVAREPSVSGGSFLPSTALPTAPASPVPRPPVPTWESRVSGGPGRGPRFSRPCASRRGRPGVQVRRLHVLGAPRLGGPGQRLGIGRRGSTLHTRGRNPKRIRGDGVPGRDCTVEMRLPQRRPGGHARSAGPGGRAEEPSRTVVCSLRLTWSQLRTVICRVGYSLHLSVLLTDVVHRSLRHTDGSLVA